MNPANLNEEYSITTTNKIINTIDVRITSVGGFTDRRVVVTLAVIAVLVIAGAVVAAMFLKNMPKDINSVDDLKGSNIAVQKGSTADDYVTDHYETNNSADVIRFVDFEVIFKDLEGKKVDAVIMDKAPAKVYLKNHSGLRILSDVLQNEDYGFIFNNTNTELRDKFNAKLTEMKDDGKLDEIKEYWYTHGDGAAASITENGTGETIRVVTDSSFPPYDSKNGNEFTGMDMDIVREICNRLDYKVQFATVGFDSIIDEVSKGNYDVGASALSITEDRKAKVLFSECYESSELIVVTRA